MVEAIDFFRALYRRCSPEGQIEFLFIPSREQIFIPLSRLKLPTFPKDQNVYFGVATRNDNGGGKENLEQIPALWIDYDRKGMSVRNFREKLELFRFRPSIIMETGGGSHIYWLLRRPATKEDIPRVEAILKAMASHLGADLAATDASRILRVPGTLNIKYEPPFRTTIKKLDDPPLEYDLEDFDFLQDGKSEEVVSDNQSFSHWVDDILKGVPEGKRNSSAARLAGRYFKRGLFEAEVLGFLSAWNQNNKPPLSKTEIERTVKSVARTIARKKGPSHDDQNF